MSHMVIFRTPEGKPGYQPAETVNDAVAVVERLRNDEGVENVRIFRLEELTFEYRPYYKVELAGASTEQSSPEPVAVLDEPGPNSDDEQTAEESSSDSTVEGAIDVANQEVEAGSDSVANDEPSETQAASQPPWAAPPPPPPPGAPAESSPFGSVSDEEEFTSAARRGLFGR